MLRNRIKWTVVLALAILPLMGCANRRCCDRPAYSARPVMAAPCNSCPNPGGPPPVVVGG